MYSNQHIRMVAEINLLVLVVGLALLTAIIILSYRELRIRKLRKREADTRLMIGSFDLYSPVDRSRVVTLIDDLYQLYLESCAACGQPQANTLDAFDRFIQTFAYSYVSGRIDFSVFPAEVATVFRIKHAQVYLVNKSA